MPAPVSNRFVTPKSERNARSDDERASDASRMFPGFTSRWTSPAAWAASSAAAACEINETARSDSSRVSARNSRSRSVPSTYRMEM